MSTRREIRAGRTGFQVIGFGDRLRRAREACGFSQLELGDYIGQSQAQVSKWEREAQLPSIDNLGRLVVALSVSADHLLDLTIGKGAPS